MIWFGLDGINGMVHCSTWYNCNPTTPPLCGSDGPEGYPELAEFARDTEDAEKPRFNIANGKAAVDGLIAALDDKFTPAQKASWTGFWSRYPSSANDIPADRLLPARSMTFPPCSTRRLSDLCMTDHQVLLYHD